MAEAEVIVILGTQMVPNHPALRAHSKATVLMIEADDLCRSRRYHKHKLMLLLASMRSYADGLKRNMRYVHYKPGTSFADVLHSELTRLKVTRVIWMHASDRGPNRLLATTAEKLGCQTTVYPNKQFVTTTSEFGGWLDSQTAKTPLMETFYRWQRKRLNILMEHDKPVGGTWNYDHENRKPLPKKTPHIPQLPTINLTKHCKDVAQLIDTHFADNPGNTENFWLPTTRKHAIEWLTSFIDERLHSFGTYEDAMSRDEPFLFHSVLSPLLNIGLLTPGECIEAALNAHSDGAPIAAVEGFTRQIIGWREFMYGLYWWKADEFDKNFFSFKKPLEDWWYTNENVPNDLSLPLKSCLDRLHTYGYSHHIERLMVFGNWFLISGYDPKSVYDWFSAMYVDAYEWVMIPNVLGMSQYADGGMLATKPYVSGGNYLQKMGRWWDTASDAKDSAYTDKYWQFIYDNRGAFEHNHRMQMVLSQAVKKLS